MIKRPFEREREREGGQLTSTAVGGGRKLLSHVGPAGADATVANAVDAAHGGLNYVFSHMARIDQRCLGMTLAVDGTESFCFLFFVFCFLLVNIVINIFLFFVS